MENPIKIDDWGVPLFSETPIYVFEKVFPILGTLWWKYMAQLPKCSLVAMINQYMEAAPSTLQVV